MTAKTTYRRVRMGALLGALSLFPLTAVLAWAFHFHLGQTLAAFGAAALFGLALVEIVGGMSLTDKDVGWLTAT